MSQLESLLISITGQTNRGDILSICVTRPLDQE